MQPKLHLICCSHLTREFELLLASEDPGNIELLIYLVQCDQKSLRIEKHPGAEFSHGICPECIRRLYPDLADEILSD